MLEVLRVSTGKGPNGLTLQSQFLWVLPRAAQAVSPLRARGRCCQHKARCSGGWRGHWGQGRAVMEHCHRHRLPSAKFCLPVCFRLKTEGLGENLCQKTSGLSPKERILAGSKSLFVRFPSQIPCAAPSAGVWSSSRSSLAWHPLRGWGSIGSRSQGCSEDQTQMQMLSPDLSTQPNAHQKG